MKIVDEVNKEFVIKAEAEQIVFEVTIVDEIDGVNKSDRVDKHREIALLSQGILVTEWQIPKMEFEIQYFKYQFQNYQQSSNTKYQ